VVGSGLLAALTACLTYNSLTRFQVGIVTFSVFVLGFFIIYGTIYVFNLLRTPYRQRNEARREIERINAELTSLHERDNYQHNNPSEFISVQPFFIYLKRTDNGMLVTGVEIKIRSWLFEEITITKIILELLLPLPSIDGRFTHRKAIFLDETNKFAINAEESRKNLPNITLNCQDKDIIISSEHINQTFQIEGIAWLWINTLTQLQISVVSNVQFIVPGEFGG